MSKRTIITITLICLCICIIAFFCFSVFFVNKSSVDNDAIQRAWNIVNDYKKLHKQHQSAIYHGDEESAARLKEQIEMFTAQHPEIVRPVRRLSEWRSLHDAITGNAYQSEHNKRWRDAAIHAAEYVEAAALYHDVSYGIQEWGDRAREWANKTEDEAFIKEIENRIAGYY